MNGGDFIGEILKKHGVNFLFTLCGGHIAPILVGCKKAGLRVIDVRQEATAVFAADAVSRLTGIPGVVAVTAGPGVTNSITALKNSQMAQSPLIFIGGAVATVLKGRGALQDIEQLELLKSVVKWSTTIKENCDIETIFNKAFDIAQKGVPGPVFIECPIDLLYDEELVRKWYAIGSDNKESSKVNHQGIKNLVTEWYLSHHVNHMFSCSFEDESEKLSRISGQENDLISKSNLFENVEKEIDQKTVKKIIEMLNTAKKPVFLLGNQVILHPNYIQNVVHALETLNVPIYLSGMARGLLGKEHSLFLRHKRTAALKEADFVLLAGVPLDFRLNYGRLINHSAKLVSINLNSEDVKKNRKPNIGIVTDPGSFLIALGINPELKFVNFAEKWNEWKDKLRERENVRKEEIFKMANEKDETAEHVNPLLLCYKIDEYLSQDSILIADGGDFVATASYIVNPRGPLSWLDPGPFGTLGVGAGFALGAKLCHPEADVWILFGDGASGYGLIEYDTFIRHNIPVIGVIGNDAGWSQITRDQVEILNDDVGTILNRSDYHKIADVFGGKGYIIKKTSEIDNVLKDALKIARNGIPVLINAYLDRSDFRKGSISM